MAETCFMLELARENAFIAGVVGWVDFESAMAPEIIAALAADAKLVGLRPMIQDIPDTEWMLRDATAPAFEAMIDHDLVFDALVMPQHLPSLLDLVDLYPELRIVAGSRREAAPAWRRPGGVEEWHRGGGPRHPRGLQTLRPGHRSRQRESGDAGRVRRSPGRDFRAGAAHVGQRLAGMRTGVFV